MSSAEHDRTAIDCPRCGATVAPDQEWCLSCGAAARTKIVTPPNWRAPVAILTTLVALSIVAFGVAFVDLTSDPKPPAIVPVPTVTTTSTPATTTTP